MTSQVTGSDIANYTEALRIILGILLIYSGAQKLRDISAFVSGVQQYQVLSPSLGRWYGRLLPYGELITGVCIFLGIILRFIALISSIIFLSFFIAVGINLYQKRSIPCQCFGTDSSIIGWHTMVRISLLFSASVYLALVPSGENLFQEISHIHTSLAFERYIPITMIVIFGLISLSIIDVFPEIVRAWTSRAIRPHSKKRLIAWSRVDDEKIGEKQ